LNGRNVIALDPENHAWDARISGYSIPVELVAEMLSQGATVEEILEGYPG